MLLLPLVVDFIFLFLFFLPPRESPEDINCQKNIFWSFLSPLIFSKIVGKTAKNTGSLAFYSLGRGGSDSVNVVERFEFPHESHELCCLEPCAPVGSPMANWSRRREQTKNGSRAVRSCAPQSLNTRGAWRTTKTILINLTNKLLPFHKH